MVGEILPLFVTRRGTASRAWTGGRALASRYNDPMASENRLVWIVFAVLIALIAVPLALWRFEEARRPVLDEVRLVTATADDPVFRNGLRRVAADTEVFIAAAVRIRRPGRSAMWLAPVERLEIDGRSVDHSEADEWPEDDRVLRVLWFTVESSFLGGDLTAETAGKLLSQRTFLAPEMGRGLLASRVPDQHNDDQINLGDEDIPVAGGTVRLYAKVEIVARVGAVATEQSVTSLGLDALEDPRFTSLRLAEAFPSPIRPELGELFRLSGFEPRTAADASWNDVTRAATGSTFIELVERRYLVSSVTFASMAVAGELEMDDDRLESSGQVAVNTDPLERGGRRLSWGRDVHPGDLLKDRDQWIVLLADDGDGELGFNDRVAHCWRRPPVVTILGQAIRDDAVAAELLSHGS